MADYTRSRFWLETLAHQPGDDIDARPREVLRSAYLAMRDRAALLAAEIARDMPHLTVHDDTHLDALWDLAELVAGPAIALSPAEAFALGGAILLHDLGMSVAAYVGGRPRLREDELWRDALAAELRRHSGRVPSQLEMDGAPEEVRTTADVEVLRERHAARAEELANASWRGPTSGEVFHLLDDPELRFYYAPVIGKLAHSHWQSADELRQVFPRQLNAVPGYPATWQIDPLKLACLLRLADALHVDARRAPLFLRAVRQLNRISAEHWDFQRRLAQPRCEANRIVFTGTAFPQAEANAWWRCLEALQYADDELRRVDALLADSHQPRFRAVGVAGVESPDRLTAYIPTEGWLPVDARIRVTSAGELVRRLGGQQLYGQNEYVPLRELIQNAADAVRARRLLQPHLPSGWGEITVSLGEDPSGPWLEVADNGVGMSQSVLTGPFLDFGVSGWQTGLIRSEFPGLSARGFEPTGQYGIGFFSVFMVGDRVQVISRRYDAAHDQTEVLEFFTGLTGRPLLRRARREEHIVDGGTRVRVWLEREIAEKYGTTYDVPVDELPENGEASPDQQFQHDMVRRLDYICPSLDVTLTFKAKDGSSWPVLTANDWLVIDGRTLVKRTDNADQDLWMNYSSELFRFAENALGLIKSRSGQILGRAALCPAGADLTHGTAALVTVGGFRSRYYPGLIGVLLGQSVSVRRDDAILLALDADLAEWAEEQARIWSKSSWPPELLAGVAGLVCEYGGSPLQLPLGVGPDGWLNRDAIKSWAAPLDEVIVVPKLEDVVNSGRRGRSSFGTPPNTLIVSDPGGRMRTMRQPFSRRAAPAESGTTGDVGVVTLIIHILAEAWRLPSGELPQLAYNWSSERTWDEKSRPNPGKPWGVICLRPQAS